MNVWLHSFADAPFPRCENPVFLGPAVVGTLGCAQEPLSEFIRWFVPYRASGNFPGLNGSTFSLGTTPDDFLAALGAIHR